MGIDSWYHNIKYECTLLESFSRVSNSVANLVCLSACCCTDEIVWSLALISAVNLLCSASTRELNESNIFSCLKKRFLSASHHNNDYTDSVVRYTNIVWKQHYHNEIFDRNHRKTVKSELLSLIGWAWKFFNYTLWDTLGQALSKSVFWRIKIIVYTPHIVTQESSFKSIATGVFQPEI